MSRINHTKNTSDNFFLTVDVDFGVTKDGHGLTVFVHKGDSFLARFFNAGFGVSLMVEEEEDERLEGV